MYEDDDPRGVMAEHLTKLRNILARLDAASSVEDMNIPGFALHPLKGRSRAFGLSRYEPIGGSSSGLRMAMRLRLIIWITTKEVSPCR